YRIVSAYRMLNNVLGIRLQAAMNTDGITAAGRMAPGCSGCHYHPVYGLDLAAKVLTKKVLSSNPITFTTTTDGPQLLLGGQTIADDAAFINAMVNSTDFKFNTCRLAMGFLYGRAEFKCEGPVFDKCMAAFSSTGMMQSALSAVAKDSAYCQ